MVVNDDAGKLTPRGALRLIASRRIVTKTVKSVYQKHGYMNETPTPKIHLANPAT
jgi:hypothetical protein